MQQQLIIEAMVEEEIQMPIRCVHIVEGLDIPWRCVTGSMASHLILNLEMDLHLRMFPKIRMVM